MLNGNLYGCRPVTSMYPFWLLSSWVLIYVSFVSGVWLLVSAVGKPREHALPRLTAGGILVLSAALVLLLCRFAVWSVPI